MILCKRTSSHYFYEKECVFKSTVPHSFSWKGTPILKSIEGYKLLRIWHPNLPWKELESNILLTINGLVSTLYLSLSNHYFLATGLAIALFITHVIYSVFLHSFYHMVTSNSSIHEVHHNPNMNLPVLSQVYSTHSKCRVSYMKLKILGRYYLSVPR